MNITDILPKNKIEVVFMRKLVLITGVVVYVLFVVSTFIAIGTEGKMSVLDTAAPQSVTTESLQQQTYTVKNIDGKITVLNSENNIIKTTDTLVALLPISDQTRLNKGIQVNGENELRTLLEDFCS